MLVNFKHIIIGDSRSINRVFNNNITITIITVIINNNRRMPFPITLITILPS
jgi:ABC-type methionine transport system permease subunit